MGFFFGLVEKSGLKEVFFLCGYLDILEMADILDIPGILDFSGSMMFIEYLDGLDASLSSFF